MFVVNATKISRDDAISSSLNCIAPSTAMGKPKSDDRQLELKHKLHH
jgi:hypothetical protein